MGLFDDLIKKSTSQPTGDQAGGSSLNAGVVSPMQNQVVQTSVQTPVIENAPLVIQKTQEESIMTEKPVMVNPDLPDSPAPVQSSVDDGTSLLIVGSEESPIVDPLVSSQTVPPAPQEAIIPEIETPPVSVPTMSESVQSTSPTVTSDNEKPSLMEIQRERMRGAPQVEITEEQSALLNNLLGSSVTAETGETSLIKEAGVIGANESKNSPEETNQAFDNPREFIETSLEKINLMIDRIDQKHAIKLGEAEGYKAEKERNAGLEADCYAMAEKMMQERAHAEKMRKYFLSQKEQAINTSEDGSVETTLTSLSVKKTVNDATSSKKTQKKEKEVEDIIPMGS